MNRNRAAGLLALLLALLVPAMGIAEELGEMDLYDPSIFVDGGDAPMPGDNLLLPEETLAPESLPEPADEPVWVEADPDEQDDDVVLFADAPEALEIDGEIPAEEAPAPSEEAQEPTPEPAVEPSNLQSRGKVL